MPENFCETKDGTSRNGQIIYITRAFQWTKIWHLKVIFKFWKILLNGSCGFGAIFFKYVQCSCDVMNNEWFLYVALLHGWNDGLLCARKHYWGSYFNVLLCGWTLQKELCIKIVTSSVVVLVKQASIFYLSVYTAFKISFPICISLSSVTFMLCYNTLYTPCMLLVNYYCNLIKITLKANNSKLGQILSFIIREKLVLY